MIVNSVGQSVNSLDCRAVINTAALLGEGPVWDDIRQVLFWVDILSSKIYCFDSEIHFLRSWDVGGHIGAIALREQNGLIVAHKNGFGFLNLTNGSLEFITHPEKELSDNRFNDGKCDHFGRFWAGTMSYSLKRNAGSLYVIGQDLVVSKRINDVTISNGLAWNHKKNLFYYIDSINQAINCYDFDIVSGNIANKRIVTEIPQKLGTPDGMTIDTQDHLWVALYGGGKVVRINPTNGEIVLTIKVAAKNVTSCTFGGKNLNELYITTARENLSSQELDDQPLSGSLFKVTLPFTGTKCNRFKG